MAWRFSPESIPVEMAEPLARVWDESERAKNAFAVLVPGRNPFHVGNKPRSMDIDVFHDRTGHLSDPILRESARQQGITLTGRMEPCNSCLPVREGRAQPGPQRRAGDRHVRPVHPIAKREPLHVSRHEPRDGVHRQLRPPSQVRGVIVVQALCGGHGAQGGNGGKVCPGRLRRPLD